MSLGDYLVSIGTTVTYVFGFFALYVQVFILVVLFRERKHLAQGTVFPENVDWPAVTVNCSGSLSFRRAWALFGANKPVKAKKTSPIRKVKWCACMDPLPQEKTFAIMLQLAVASVGEKKKLCRLLL